MRHRAEPQSPSSTPAETSATHRFRLGVGAAVVLVIAAFVVAVLFAATGAPEHAVAVPPPSRTPSPEATDTASSAAAANAAESHELFIHVTGAVRAPGLVNLPSGARVIDAITAAGGLGDDADPAGINLARLLQDGEQLAVPRPGEAVSTEATRGPGAGPDSASGATGVVDLNRATQADLETLPRIGPALAQRILDWRSANGRFADPRDLLEVAGIGQKIFEGVANRVRV